MRTENRDSFDLFLRGLLEKNEEDIIPEMREEFSRLVATTLSKIELSSTEPLDVLREILSLLEKIEQYIVAEKRQEFEDRIKSALWKSNAALIQTLSKETKDYVGSVGIQKEWHELHETLEIRERRSQLLRPSTKREFVAALMWMVERGSEIDLSWLGDAKTASPYSSEEIEQLFEIAEQRIRQRAPKNIQDLSWAAFQSHLPQLLQEAPGKWVAFHGERQAALSDSKQEVYARLQQMNCPLQEVIVRRVKPLRPPLNLQRFRRSRVQ